MKKERLKFISYDGEYPNLCSGILVMELDGNKVEFPKYCLSSGGRVCCNDDGHENVRKGSWSVSEFPKDFPKELEELAENIVNKKIDYGCCGGCI